MRITPLRPMKPRPIALLTPGYREVTITTVDDERTHRGANRCYDAMRRLEGHQVYVASHLRRLLHTTGATAWTAQVWRGRAATMNLDGTGLAVTSLRRTLNDLATPPERFAALNEVVETLSDRGVRAGSLSSMAWNAWRASLNGPLEIGFNPPVSKAALYGGRKQASPHSYSDQVAIDVKSAYPSAMVSRPFSLSLREVDPSSRIDPSSSGLAKVRVIVPDDLPFSPLPTRVGPEMIQWRRGVVEGVYPWVEVAAAQSLGCEVEVLRSWAPMEEADLFSRWWTQHLIDRDAVGEGALRMMKALANLVWSGFALNPEDAEMVRWIDDMGDHPVRADKRPRPMPQRSTLHVAAEVTARVRVQMLLEGLYGDSEVPVHVDTDGMIVSRESALRRTKGTGAGEWRVKTEMSICEVKAPQLYRYDCGPLCGADPGISGSHSRWHYVASGTPASRASELFDRHPGFQVSFDGLDAVVPAEVEMDPEQLSKWKRAKELVEESAFGPRLV